LPENQVIDAIAVGKNWQKTRENGGRPASLVPHCAMVVKATIRDRAESHDRRAGTLELG
jgi:hypothetical protein